jgi:NAD(P)-dependent dehydrogenase (short-subunit alcohol dehydrogenase family)
VVSTKFDIGEKRVLITGAGRGIGPGIADVLSAAGADIALNALTPHHVTTAASKIANTTGRSVHPVVGDVTTSSGATGVVQEAMDRLGGLDVLINCLGDALGGPLAVVPNSDTEAMTQDALEHALDLNLRSAILCSRVIGPHFLARGSGNVINISSVTAIRGGAGLSVYAAAKAGLIGFTRALALEWAPKVRVNSIAPGWFPDPALQTEEMRAHIEGAAASVPAGRVGDPREVGYLALYLIAPASDYVTGQTIFIDGGASLG